MAIRVEEVAIRMPCEASWDAMSSVEGGRHFAACDLTVRDLSLMTESEVRDVLASREASRICVRYQPTVGGTIRTAHSPVIPASRLLAKAKPFALAAGAMLASACGPVIDAMPYSVRDEIPYALESAMRHPIDFAACAVSPTCDALAPPVVLGGI